MKTDLICKFRQNLFFKMFMSGTFNIIDLSLMGRKHVLHELGKNPGFHDINRTIYIWNNVEVQRWKSYCILF